MRPSHIEAILDQEFLSCAQGIHTPVMLWGPPGVGKSQIIAGIARRHGARLVDIRLSQMEPTDLRGIPFKTSDDRVKWSVPEMLPDSNSSEPGILFLDEINAAPPSVSAAAYQLILDRRLGEYVMPKNWAIFAAGNRQGDRGVTYAMPAPLANRFTHYHVEPNLDDWIAWALEHNIDERIMGFLRFRPDLLFRYDPAHNPEAFPSPRSWEYADRALKKFGHRPDLLTDTLQACVGDDVGVELKAYIDNMENLPDIDAILEGREAGVPKTVDLQYGVAAALVRRAKQAAGDTDKLANILKYARRFPQREMGVMLVTDLHRAVGQPLFRVPEFVDWANSVAELMLYDFKPTA
ncbi:MAG: AAA family ATPase [Thiobacillaceae bacterium]